MDKMKNVYSLTVMVCILFCFSTAHVFGYGYGKRGKDTLVSVYENIQGFIVKNDYRGVKRELKRIDVPLANYANYYKIDLRLEFLRAIEREDVSEIRECIEELVYLAIREKIYWNKKEALEKYMAGNARIRMLFQYHALLKLKIKEYDRKNNTALNREIVKLLIGMKKMLGSPSIYGYKSDPPDLGGFEKLSRRLEEIFVIVFPYFDRVHKATINPH